MPPPVSITLTSAYRPARCAPADCGVSSMLFVSMVTVPPAGNGVRGVQDQVQIVLFHLARIGLEATGFRAMIRNRFEVLAVKPWQNLPLFAYSLFQAEKGGCIGCRRLKARSW